MAIVFYVILLPACTFITCVFGFFVGRCARRLPVLDDHLPWTLHRGQSSTEGGGLQGNQRADPGALRRPA
jgi:hypothetical protein